MSKECFVIMPFSDRENPGDNRWDDLFENNIKPAVEGAALGYTCVRSFNPHGNFMSDIVEHLASAEVVIAVLTELRPNVMYELGARHALKRKTIMLAEKGGQIPSDLSSYIALFYSTATQKGRDELRDEIRQRLQKLDAAEPKSDNPVSDFLWRRAQSINDDWQKGRDPEAILPRLAEILPSYAFGLAPVLNELSQQFETLRRKRHATSPPVESIPSYGPIPLDRGSLSMYVGSSSRVKQLDRRMAEANDTPLLNWDPTLDAFIHRLLEKAEYLGIRTVAELDETVAEFGEIALHLSYYYRVKDRWYAGTCLERVFDVKAAHSGKKNLIRMYQSAKNDTGGAAWAEDVWRSYEQIITYGVGTTQAARRKHGPRLRLLGRMMRQDWIVLGLRNYGDDMAKSLHVEVTPPYGYTITQEGVIDGGNEQPLRMSQETADAVVKFEGGSEIVLQPGGTLEFAALTWDSMKEAFSHRAVLIVEYSAGADGAPNIEDRLTIEVL